MFIIIYYIQDILLYLFEYTFFTWYINNLNFIILYFIFNIVKYGYSSYENLCGIKKKIDVFYKYWYTIFISELGVCNFN